MNRSPYPGEMRLGSTGEAVVLLKRALRLAGLLPGRGKPTGFLGPFARAALVRLGNANQLPLLARPGVLASPPGWHHRLRTFQTGGIYGPNAHTKLANYYDDYGATRLRAITRARQIMTIQAAGLAACNLVIHNRGVIHYTQSALRMSGVRSRLTPPRFGTWEDCSSEATWIAFVMDQVAKRIGGRYHDPNGFDYNGQGFTGTLTQNGRVVPAASGPLAFTLVFYFNPISHVATKLTAATVESMGSEAGPLEEPTYYVSLNHARVYLPTLPA